MFGGIAGSCGSNFVVICIAVVAVVVVVVVVLARPQLTLCF